MDRIRHMATHTIVPGDNANQVNDASEARRILKRRAAQFAITVHDRITGSVSTIGTVWTGSDRVLKAVA